MGKKKTSGATMQARVLGGFVLDGVQYDPDDIIDADPEMIQQLGSSVDANPSAVEYCLKLENPVVKRYESKNIELQQSGEWNQESESSENIKQAQAGN